MNKKNLALVLFMLIAVLALSAFRWAPSHEEGVNQRSLDADAARYTAMAEFYNAETSSIQRGLDADAARYTAMAKYYMSERNSAAMLFHYGPPGR